ncbi:MAG: tRNA (adenosine(37)-N6)-threonylcarbamoyltransferase complex ATPase subunit type 1 TsaE [Actinomycetota bacterium]
MSLHAVPLDGDLTPVAEAVLQGLGPGDDIHLSGPLGAGKTALVRAACQALGVAEPVTSPTFALAHRYAGRIPVVHLDLYRLQEQPLRDPADLLGELTDDALAFVEWPEVGVPWLPPPTRRVLIDLEPDGTRRFAVDGDPAPASL